MSSHHASLSSSTEQFESAEPDTGNYDEGLQNWLIVGDGDLSYGAMMADELSGSSSIRLTATVLEEETVHNQVYERSKENAESIASHPLHRVRFGIDATELPTFFPDTKFDSIEFNFPHWRGKTNNKRNRQLADAFFKSAASVLKPDGEIRVALCHGQGGVPSDDLQEWRQSWMPAMYAAEHGLLLSRLEPFEPVYGLSSHRGVDRPFYIGKNPQKYFFRFPNGESVPEDIQMSCRHELRIMLHPDKVEASSVSRDQIITGDALLELGKEFIPEGIRFEIPARHVMSPYWLEGDHVPLAVFLLNYSGESMPLTRSGCDKIRDSIEKEIMRRWGLEIAKAGRLVSRPYPFLLLPKLIKTYGYD
jgi:hypothetical protein